MEILAETTYWGEYNFVLVILGLFTTAIGAVLVLSIADKDVFNSVGLFLATLVCVFFIAIVIHEGPTVEYTAKVTDYNEVYSQDYKVDRHEGELVILTKEGR